MRLRAFRWSMLVLLALLVVALVSQGALAQDGTCIDDVTSRINVCRAGDIQLSTLVSDEDTTCMPGELVTLNLKARLLATSLERYDIGIFLALDGGDASTGSCQRDYLPPPLASGGTCSGSGSDCKKDADCLVDEVCTGGYNPGSPGIGGGPFYNAEPEDELDMCGDLEQGVDTYYLLAPVTVECVDSDGDGLLDIGTAVSWDDHATNSCQGVADAIPNTPAKCRYAIIDVGNVVVSPGLIQVRKTADPEQLLEPGGWVTFTFAVKNASPTEVILEALNDSVYGPLEEADGGCSLPRTLEPDVTYTCTLRVEVTGTVGVHEDVVIASGTDQNKNPVSDSARAQVTIVRLPPEAGMGTPAAIVAGGMAAGGLVLLLAGTLLRRRTT